MVTDLSKIQASIALPVGTAMYERLSKEYPHLLFVPTKTETEAFYLVENKKVDLTMRSLIVTAYTIKKEGLFNLKIAGKPERYTNYLRMGVLKQERVLKDILDKAIVTITPEEIDNIVNKYVGLVVENTIYYSIGVWVFVLLLVVTLLILVWNYMLQKKVAAAILKNKEQQALLFEQAKEAELGG
jgi:hypothetical protein